MRMNSTPPSVSVRSSALKSVIGLECHTPGSAKLFGEALELHQILQALLD